MKFMTKKALVLVLGLLVSFSLVGCKDTATTTTTTAAFTGATPVLTNPDEVFYDGGSYLITYGDVYEEFKINDGINRLLFMVDSVLLSDYIASVTDEQIAAKILYLTYGTNNSEEIALLTDQEKQDYQDTFAENMNLLGYADNQDEYVRLVCAKEAYAVEQMYNEANASEDWYAGPEGVASYYQDTYFEDYSAIKIRFYNETDAKNVLKAFNLVSYNGTLRLYTGVTPIDQVPSSSFNDTNTQVLTNEEILSYFIQMYNYVYSYKADLATDATFAELVANTDLTQNYETLNGNSTALATYMFSTLGSYDTYTAGTSTKIYYTYTPVKYYGASDTAYYMILNLDRSTKADVTDFSGDEAALVALIGQSTYDTIESTIQETNVTTTGYTANRISELRAANDLVIYDYYLGIDYQSIDASYVLNEEGDEAIVASFADTTITADQLFISAMATNGGIYALYAAQMIVAMDQYFAQVYCEEDQVNCSYNLDENTSAKLAADKASLEELRASFEASYYVYYYTFEEYMYLAYGAKTETEMLLKYYVKSTLQPYLVYDEIKKNDWELLTGYLYNLIQDYYDNYFSLNVQHLLIYVDHNEDGTQDNYADFVAGLDDQAQYDQLLSDFVSAIRTYLGASTTNTFATLIDTYNKAKRTDPIWGQFKNYGFYLMTENLSSTASLTYLTTVDTYETPFVEGLVATYEQYNEAANIDKASIYYDNTVETSYGVHIIYATKGSDFERPTAAFTMTYDTAGDPNYTVGIENDSDMLSVEQLKIYAEYRFYQIIYGTDATAEEDYGFTFPLIPTSVMDAIDAYFADLYDSMYVVGFLNVIVSNKLQEGTFVNDYASYCSYTDAELKARISDIGDIYFKQLFSAYDTTK